MDENRIIIYRRIFTEKEDLSLSLQQYMYINRMEQLKRV